MGSCCPGTQAGIKSGISTYPGKGLNMKSSSPEKMQCQSGTQHQSFCLFNGLFIYTRTVKSTGKPENLGRNYMAPEYLFHTLVVPDKKNAFVELFKVLTRKQLEDVKLQSYILFLFEPKQLSIQCGQLMWDSPNDVKIKEELIYNCTYLCGCLFLKFPCFATTERKPTPQFYSASYLLQSIHPHHCTFKCTVLILDL